MPAMTLDLTLRDLGLARLTRHNEMLNGLNVACHLDVAGICGRGQSREGRYVCWWFGAHGKEAGGLHYGGEEGEGVIGGRGNGLGAGPGLGLGLGSGSLEFRDGVAKGRGDGCGGDGGVA